MPAISILDITLSQGVQPEFREEAQCSCILDDFSAAISHISTKITFAGRVCNHVCYLLST